MTDYVEELTGLLVGVAHSLNLPKDIFTCYGRVGSNVQELIENGEAISAIRERINRYIEVVIGSDHQDTLPFRLFVAEYIPKFLLAYQALRFEVGNRQGSSELPSKSSLSEFPLIVAETGLYVPVSSFLRLLAVCLCDTACKTRLVDCGNVKSLMSHMVDDPLNPLQRECAVFAMNVLTRDFPPAQAAVTEIMSNRPS
jgi:hypothetical protein